MKVFVLAPQEDWICDRFVNEWYQYNSDISTRNPREADIIWLLSDWTYDQLPYELLKQKFVVTSVHHITETKFNESERRRFAHRDAITDVYHVPCRHTEAQVNKIQQQIGSKKPVFPRPFWVNEKLWFPPTPELILQARKQFGIRTTDYVIMSAQRDTEGHDLKSPKLEKGPDVFADLITKLRDMGQQSVILLGGWRRQYIMNRLDKAGIPYIYHERPGFSVVREMYWASDLYLVAARHEGGPQSIVECAAMKRPIVSTDCGLAPEILDPRSIFGKAEPYDFLRFNDARTNSNISEVIEGNYSRVSEHFLEPSFAWYREWLQQIWKENK